LAARATGSLILLSRRAGSQPNEPHINDFGDCTPVIMVPGLALRKSATQPSVLGVIILAFRADRRFGRGAASPSAQAVLIANGVGVCR
jgi:hypothetical protein